MKKNRFLILLMMSVLALTACSGDRSNPAVSDRVSEKMPEPAFPLGKDTITKTVEELGLSCVISEDESQESLSREDAVYSNYVLRDPEKKYRADSPATVLYGGFISGMVDGCRYLSAVFDSGSHMQSGKPFSWEDWKQEILFSTVLYGGFEDKEEVYRALSKLEVPDGSDGLKWGVQLSNGYCGVQKSKDSSASDSYALWINFYETEELYLKAAQEKQSEQR